MNIIEASNELIKIGKRNTKKSVRDGLMTHQEAQTWNKFYELLGEIARKVDNGL